MIEVNFGGKKVVLTATAGKVNLAPSKLAGMQVARSGPAERLLDIFGACRAATATGAVPISRVPKGAPCRWNLPESIPQIHRTPWYSPLACSERSIRARAALFFLTTLRGYANGERRGLDRIGG